MREEEHVRGPCARSADDGGAIGAAIGVLTAPTAVVFEAVAAGKEGVEGVE